MNFKAHISMLFISLSLAACSLDQPEQNSSQPARTPEVEAPKSEHAPSPPVPFLGEQLQLQEKEKSFVEMNVEAPAEEVPTTKVTAPERPAPKSTIFTELKAGDYDSSDSVRGLEKPVDLSPLANRFWFAGALVRNLGERKFFVRLMENPELWNEKDEEGRTLLHYLADLGKANILKVIKTLDLDNGFSQRDRRGRYPVHYAATAETAEILWNNTVVKSASGKSYLDPALTLKDFDGELPLHLMIAQHKTKAAVKTIESLCTIGFTAVLNGSGINAIDKFRRTPLHYAAIANDAAVADALMRCSFTDLAPVDALDRIPLHYASESPDFAAGYVLISKARPRSGQIRAIDRDRMSPLDIARKNKNEVATAILSRLE